MAPHDTNTPKEARRHAVPLIGMALAVLFGVGLVFWWIADVAFSPEETPDPPLEEPAVPAQ